MLQTESPLATYCDVQVKLLELPHSLLYSGRDRETNEQIFIWKSVSQFMINSDQIEVYINRLNVITSIGDRVITPLAFGVDSEGYAFALLPNLAGISLAKAMVDFKEAKRLFVGCSRALLLLHERQLVVGELAPESFWVGRDIEVAFIGFLGIVDESVGVEQLLKNPLFAAPDASAVDASTDVYALGMVGAILVLGARPVNHQEAVDKLIAHPEIDAPFLQILIKCLDKNPALRFPNAGAVVQALLLGDSGAPSDIQNPLSSGKVETTAVARLTNYARSATSTFKPVGSWTKPERPALNAAKRILEKTTNQPYSIKRFIFIGVGIFILMLVVGLILNGKVAKKGDSSVSMLEAMTEPGALKNAIGDLSREDVSLAKKTTALKNLYDSDDPVAHASLVQRAHEAPTLQERAVVENVILDRAKRLGLVRSKEQVAQWLKTYSNSSERPAAYLEVLKSLDPSIPPQQRADSLRLAFNSDPRIIVRLTAALALDTNNLDQLGSLLSEFLSTIVGEQEIRGKGVVALILGSSELATIYGEDVAKQIATLNDGELIWVFKQSMLRRDVLIQPLGQLLLQRNILPALRRVYLDIMVGEPKIPSDVEEVVATAVVGKIKPGQLVAISRWYDPRSTTLLTALLSDAIPDQVRQEVLEILSARDIHGSVTGSLIAWLKKKHWDKKEQFSRSVGIASLPELFDDKEVTAALTQLDDSLDDSDVVSALAKSSDPRVVANVVEKRGESLSVSDLFKLLSYHSPKVRISAVRALSGNNNIGVLKTVMESYTLEKDPEVRKVYRESFWMLTDKQ